MFWDVVRNEIGYTTSDSISTNRVSISHESVRVKQLNFYEQQFQLIYANLHRRWTKQSWAYDADAQYSFIGFSATNYNLRLSVEKRFKRGTVRGQISASQRRPDFNDQFFGSNYYFWHQPLQDVQRIHLQTQYKAEGGAIVNVWSEDVGNAIYYDSNAKPVAVIVTFLSGNSNQKKKSEILFLGLMRTF